MLHAHLHALEREHRHLEDEIKAEMAAHNDNVVKRLKIEKLHIRDEIERLKEEIAKDGETIH
jgi:hypothetical protein